MSVNADTLAIFTFENSVPATAGPFSAEVGAGSALGFHSGSGGTTTYSSPAGNGSAHSFSANGWGVGDYYQFQVDTAGYSDIGLTFDQASSNTGPGNYKLAYSTDGVNFTDFASYSVLANAAPNTPWSSTVGQNSAYTLTYDLSAITSLDDQSAVFIRLIDVNTVAANGLTVGASGTDRVDNFTVTASPVPEPSTLVTCFAGLAVLGLRFRRARS